MVSGLLGGGVLAVTLLVFIWIGVRATSRSDDVEDFVVARNSQPALTLALSFLAAGMGAWILFAPPEVGAGVGALGVAGYAVGAAAPIALFALLGPRIRLVVPRGHSLSEFVRVRFGRPFQLYVTAISLLYMLFFVTAELTAVGGVVAILTGSDGRVAVVAVAVATLAYTVYGGLRASLRTDRFQAWLILALLAFAGIAVAVLTDGREAVTATAGAPAAPRPPGLPVAITLIIAVTAANLFHQGYWQRVWAAADDRALRRGAGMGALLTVPVVALLGFLGILAAGRGLELGSPPVPFFALLTGLPTVVGVAVLVLGIALVCSSVDTLETGLASLLTVERPNTSLRTSRLLTVGLMVPAVVVALQGLSVLQLFLIADLLCAATAVPAIAALWRRATTDGALAGAIAGLVGAGAGGVIAERSLDGLRLVTMPGAVPTLPPFLGAVVASTVVTVAVSLVSRSTSDLAALGRQVPALGHSRS